MVRRLTAAVVLTLTLLVASAGAQEQPAPTRLDLERVVTLALERNPGLQAERARRGEVASGVREARSDAWPQLDLVSSWSRSRNPALLNSPDFEDIIDQFPGFEPREQELWDVAVQVTQTVYTSGKVGAGIELAELVVDVTDAQIAATRLDTALSAAEGYYRLLAAERALEAVASQQRARREALAVVEARYELGEATELERLRAVAALEEVAPAVAEAEGRIRVAESRLRSVLGLGLTVPIEAVPIEAVPIETPSIGSSPSIETYPESNPPPPATTGGPPELAALLELAADRRPELADLRLQVDALERQETVTVADGRPQVELAGSYGRQARLPENLDDPLFEDWRLSLGLTWSLFDGGRRKAQLAQLESRRDQLGWQLEELESRIALELATALADHRTAVERRRAARSSARAAREATRVATESYRLGAALQADLLDAQEREIQAELVLIEAAHQALIEAARLRRAAGLLPTEPWPSGRSQP